MQHKKILFAFLLTLLISLGSYGQKGVTTFGIQFKPIIPSGLLNTGPVTILLEDTWDVNISHKLGNNFGMVVRHGLTEKLSIETGINYVSRRYNTNIFYRDTAFSRESFKFVGYEIPVKALVYIQLGERLFMNNSLGISLDMYPTNVITTDSFFVNNTRRKGWIRPAMDGNVGFEFRTEESGYFYLGASIHLPFTPIISSEIAFKRSQLVFAEKVRTELTGSYLTLDFRYFFAEEPDPKKKKRRRN